MDFDILKKAGLSELQSKIYLYLIKKGQSTPTEIANGLNENRTTIYSATEKLTKLGVIEQKDRGRIAAFVPKHPAILESLAEKRLRIVSKQIKELESSLPDIINYYNEHQHEPGVTTLYGQEGINHIYQKILDTKQTEYFVRSRHDDQANPDNLRDFKEARAKAKIRAENIAPSEYHDSQRYDKETTKYLLTRTLLPPSEYDSPVEINIFGNNVAFINYSQGGMSTLIESPEIADAMRQFFNFSRKYIRKATNQDALLKTAGSKAETHHN